MDNGSNAGVGKNTPRLSLASMFGYGLGNFSLGMSSNLFNFYFIFFATTIAGINPAFAGTISFIAILWDAVSDPILGSMSDNLTGKYGRRRPFLIAGILPLVLSMIALFTKVDFGGFTNIYYIIAAIAFWTSYTIYGVPYSALGAELTVDFKKRNTLNLVMLLFTLLSLFVVSTFTVQIAETVASKGYSIERGWFVAAVMFGIVSLIAGFICWISTKGREKDYTVDKSKNINIIKTYVSIFNIKSLRILCVGFLLYAVGFTIVTGNQIFLLTNNLGLRGPDIGKFFLINAILGALLIPVVGFIADKVGKRKAYTGIIFIASLGQILFAFIGLKSFTSMIILGALQNLCNNTFFSLSMSMNFDCCQIDEFVSGKSREGALLTVTSLFQKFGYAVGGWIMGILLQFSGFIGSLEVQSPETIKGLLRISTVYAPVFFIVSTIVVSLYRMNEEKFKALREAIELKKEGKEYSTETFKDIL